VRTAQVCVAPALICVQPRLPGTFVSVGPVNAKSPTCPASFDPQQKASRTTVIAHVCRDPKLIELNFAPGCTGWGLRLQRYGDFSLPQVVSMRATAS